MARESILPPANVTMPFHHKFIGEILANVTPCLGVFTVKDLILISATCKRAYRLTVKHKLIKKLVRFGNLDSTIRMAFWRKLSSY